LFDVPLDPPLDPGIFIDKDSVISMLSTSDIYKHLLCYHEITLDLSRFPYSF